MATKETEDISADEPRTASSDGSDETSSGSASEMSPMLLDTSTGQTITESNTEVDDPHVPLTTLDPVWTDAPAPTTISHTVSRTKGLPDFTELHSSDSASSSNEADEDFLIPDFDALDDEENNNGASSSQGRRIIETDDPQILQRRDRNKKAASACRQRQKDKAEKLEKEVSHLQAENTRYKRQIYKNQEQIKKLTAIIKQHLPNCKIWAETMRKHQLAVEKRNQRTARTLRQNSGTFVPGVTLGSM